MKLIRLARIGFLAAFAALALTVHPAERVPLRVRIEPATDGIARVIPLAFGSEAQNVGVKSGKALVHLQADVPALVCAGAEGMNVACEFVQTGAPEERTFALVEGREVRMRCLLDGEPVRDAVVRLHRASIPARVPYALPLSYTAGRIEDRVLTDDQGEAVIAHLAPGTYRFEVSIDKYPPYDAGEIEIPPQRTFPDGSREKRSIQLADFTIDSGVSVEVEVLDGDAIPVTSGAVGIRQPRAHETGSFAAQTSDGTSATLVQGRVNDEGRVTFSGLDPSRAVSVTCQAEGYERQKLEFATPPAVVTCTLSNLASTSGDVTDEARQPIAGARVRIGERSVTTDGAGHFSVTSLPAGEAEVTVSAQRYAHASHTVRMLPGEMTPAGTFVLKRGWHVTGRVLDALTKEPVRGAAVRLVADPGSSATTDDEGAYEVDAEHLGVIEASAAGYADADRVVTERTANDFFLQRPGSMIVSVWDENRNSPCVACTITAGRGRIMRSAITNAAAEVRFDGLPPGDYDVLKENVYAASTYVTVSGGADTITATVTPNATARVQLGKAREVDVAFVPAASGRQLRASGAAGVEIADADPAGSFRIKHQPQGASLALLTPTTGVVVGAIPPRATASRIELHLWGTLATVRYTRDGQPGPGMQVTIRGAAGEIAAWGTTDARSEVQFAHLPPGRYGVTAATGTTASFVVDESSPGLVELSDD
jgi:hypothetical protein